MKTRRRTLSYGSSEEINCTASDIGLCITQCTSKCGEDFGVKYFVPEALCDYLSMNIP